jgi:hypothetical protein
VWEIEQVPVEQQVDEQNDEVSLGACLNELLVQL